MAIEMSEILMGRAKFEELSEEVKDNLQELHRRINVIRKAYGKPMKVNDGLRFAKHTPKNGSKTSWHLKGAAIDIDDDDNGTLWNWIKDNLELFQQVGLWIEDPRWTHGNGSWMHFQIYPPTSGKRIFVPSSAPASAPEIWNGKYKKELDK
jgi:hypothetical protein